MNWFDELFIKEAKSSLSNHGGSCSSDSGGSGGGSSEEWIGDGNTHLWITLPEGRTSPMLGVCPKGTVTVDWGDGSEPDVLTGTSTSTVKWTPNHEYAKPGDYVITLTADGSVNFSSLNSTPCVLRHAINAAALDRSYLNAVQKIELGNSVTSINNNAFAHCYNLTSVNILDGVTNIGSDVFSNCYNLTSVNIPDGVTKIGSYAFASCGNLTSVNIPVTAPNPSMCMFENCRNLTSISIPDGATVIGDSAFNKCYNLTSIFIPGSVTRIDNSAFGYCYGMQCYDFSRHTSVPTLSNTNAFTSIPADCEIRVPAALYDEWIAATNWATYASQIVAV